MTSNMTPVGIWVRVSTGGQDEKNQMPDIEKYCAAHGYEPVRRYELNDKSAFHGDQETRQAEALDDARHGVIKALVIWASDRLERRGAEATLRIFRLFREVGARVESVLEPFLNDGDSGELLTAITGWKDRQESARKSERARISRDARLANGDYIGRAGWGLQLVTIAGRITLGPSPDGTRYAGEMFERVDKGQSLRIVARWLTDQRCRTTADSYVEVGPLRPWWPRTVGGIIRNPVYMGYACQLDDPKKNTHGQVVHRWAGLVDPGLWKRANDRLDKAPKRGPRKPNRAMLTGIIYCPKCKDSPMYRIGCTTRHKDGSKDVRYYYRCTGRGPDRKGCGNMVPLASADAMAACAVENGLAFQHVIRTTFVPGHNHEAELAELGFQLKQVAAALAEDDADEDALTARQAALLAERARLKALPATPDTWKETELPETYADVWRGLTNPERGDWLKANGFRAEADRDALTLFQPGHGSVTVIDTPHGPDIKSVGFTSGAPAGEPSLADLTPVPADEMAAALAA